jgi:hypothetical protein
MVVVVVVRVGVRGGEEPVGIVLLVVGIIGLGKFIFFPFYPFVLSTVCLRNYARERVEKRGGWINSDFG